MKKSILALSIGAAVSCSAQAEVLITELVENGNNKAVEIYNSGSESVDLSAYTLVQLNNQNKKLSEKRTTLSGTLASKDVFVVAHTDLAGKLNDGTVDLPLGLAFNGADGDTVILEKDGEQIDIVGFKKVDDNSVKDVFENSSLQRLNADTAKPTMTFNAAEWEDAGQGVYTGLGKGVITEPTPPENIVKSTIQEIQGDSWNSTIDGIDTSKKIYESTNYHEVTGVVTAIQKTALKNEKYTDLNVGFFMQAPSDNNALTSDGIFVETSKITDIAVGDEVTVVAKVKEDYNWTKLVGAYSVTKTDSANSVLAATPLRVLDSNENFDFTLERHEGMLVKFDKESDMRVSRTFGFNHYPFKRNNMVVSNGQVNLHPNQNNAPVVHDDATDTAPERQTDSNEEKRIVVESFEKVSKGTHIPWYPDFGSDSAVPMPDGTTTTDDYVRIGDVLDGIEGVIGYSYYDFRFYVTNTVTKDNFARDKSQRTSEPKLKEGGELRIATFNVLNYFNSPFGGDCNPTDPSDRDSVKDQACSNRGAPSLEEFELQGDKIARAIIAIDADIVGLMEIENNGFGENSAVAHLVNKINALIDDEKEHYSYVVGSDSDKYVGTDAIASQVIFKASKASLDTYRLIEMPEQHAPATTGESGNNYQRDTITPTFSIKGTDEKVTVAVNHFKSKGSKCWEDAAPVAEGGQAGKDPDKQGSCENFRVSAAYHLGQELNKIDGYKLILGDLNSYGNEDPIMVLTNSDNAPEGHVIKAARNTYIGGDENALGTPLHGDEGAVINDSYGYVNIIRQIHPDSYSYSYNDEVGTLDYILVTPELVNKVVDATDWNINAGESTLFEYENENNCLDGKCSSRFSDLYRASDHDPAVIDLKFSDNVDPEPPVITPPTEPKNPPADLPEVPAAPVAGEPIKVMFDLTNIGGVALHEGDKAVLNIEKISSFKAAVAGADTSSVTLTKTIIEQGWVELKGEVTDAGEFKMTKQIIDGVTGQPTYTSQEETIKVTEGKTQAVDPNPGHNHGGSTGLFGLLSLLGLGFFRRKMNK
ncbi:ExeM/NucH family extracellular endonuclease [Photobacterium alginatilyticum]|uniref:ExeM/NucH family extracellular endonuclease n=1 Tax=Photobacterium alginatilyticum TaxID=1775171 RepID=A0ABW9YPB0_9GAMM|nr:ExeM/NucH family extracellular endonuclease [Photobacterium alginatilyticum]NBI55724.1 ExeM/NucH family extracellular endonuclease [Photobacterium alginatilyticum]